MSNSMVCLIAVDVTMACLAACAPAMAPAGVPSSTDVNPITGSRGGTNR